MLKEQQDFILEQITHWCGPVKFEREKLPAFSKKVIRYLAYCLHPESLHEKSCHPEFRFDKNQVLVGLDSICSAYIGGHGLGSCLHYEMEMAESISAVCHKGKEFHVVITFEWIIHAIASALINFEASGRAAVEEVAEAWTRGEVSTEEMLHASLRCGDLN